MCRLAYTPELHQALRDAHDQRVVFHPGNTGPMQGFYWAGDGHMSAGELDALASLEFASLVAVGPPTSDRRRGNPVPATREGVQRLAEWDARTAKNRSAA